MRGSSFSLLAELGYGEWIALYAGPAECID